VLAFSVVSIKVRYLFHNLGSTVCEVTDSFNGTDVDPSVGLTAADFKGCRDLCAGRANCHFWKIGTTTNAGVYPCSLYQEKDLEEADLVHLNHRSGERTCKSYTLIFITHPFLMVSAKS